MQKYRYMLRRRVLISLIDGFIILSILILLIARGNPFSTSRIISYDTAAGHILVQLAELPESTGAMPTTAEWTLYGDGTLMFRTDPGDSMWRAQLSSSAIQHILDVIINHDSFFSTSARQYGRIIPRYDDDVLLLTVDANGMHRQTVIASEPGTGGAGDIQTRHMFAIEQFLFAYHPLHAVFYAPNYDPDGDDGN